MEKHHDISILTILHFIELLSQSATKFQMVTNTGHDESEQDSVSKPASMPNKRKSALDRLNESSDSDIAFNDNSVQREKSADDSEDDFDFFD